MNAIELHRQNPALELAPILRVIKYMGFDSNSLSPAEIDKILHLYPDFERDPELVVGIEAVSRLTEMEASKLTELLSGHRHEIPFLGTTAHPMVPASAIDMIRAVADGEDPFAPNDERLFTLTEMSERTEISLASLSKYVKEHRDRIPSKQVGKMRKFPREAIPVFRQIKAENLGRRGGTRDRLERQKAAVSRRYATKLGELEAQLEAAVEVSKELSRTLNRLANQVRRARATAESGSKIADVQQSKGARRSGGHRPDTIVAACKKILADADAPMRVADITERIIGMGTPINAKNPNVTVSSILSSYDDFRRVKRGYYELVNRAVHGDAAATGADRASAKDPVDPSTAEAAAEGRRTREDVGPSAEAATTPVVERDPGDVLADLQAAAASEERASERRARERARKLDLEPFGAPS